VALHALLVERFRGIRLARLSFEGTTLLIGENGCGKSSLLEAMALVLSPLGPRRPRVEPWHFHRATPDVRSDIAGPIRISVTLVESATRSWDRPELAALAPVLGASSGGMRSLTVELHAAVPAGDRGVDVHWEIRGSDGRALRDDEHGLEAVRSMNPLVWLRGGTFVRDEGLASNGPGAAPPADVAAVLHSYDRLLQGDAASEEAEVEAGYAAAERLIEKWAPGVQSRGTGVRAAVAEVLGRSIEDPSGWASHADDDAPGMTAKKVGVFVLTARILQHLKAPAAGVRPIVVIEEFESGLHPMTLASSWDLLERLPMQKVLTTNSGTLLAAAPLGAVRRLVRDQSGLVKEWRVPEGTFSRDDLRRISYHLRARRGAACFARCWLLVEGETEFWILPDLAHLCGYGFAEEGLACVEFAQCGLRPLVKLARALGIEWHVLADGDRAGASYAQAARAMADGDQPDTRVTFLAERDVEHCFWEHGHAHVFHRLAATRPGVPGLTPRRVIEKAIGRHSKPGVAFQLLASVAEPGSAGPPPPLRRTIETCVALARGRRTHRRANDGR
jgi:putative ATP-dependent endonuclease of OLD family